MKHKVLILKWKILFWAYKFCIFHMFNSVFDMFNISNTELNFNALQLPRMVYGISILHLHGIFYLWILNERKHNFFVLFILGTFKKIWFTYRTVNLSLTYTMAAVKIYIYIFL